MDIPTTKGSHEEMPTIRDRGHLKLGGITASAVGGNAKKKNYITGHQITGMEAQGGNASKVKPMHVSEDATP